LHPASAAAEVLNRMTLRSKAQRIQRLDFMIAGTQKGGTSALHCHLDQHPNITMAHPEEAHTIAPGGIAFFVVKEMPPG
jgi:hypothetical protein